MCTHDRSSRRCNVSFRGHFVTGAGPSLVTYGKGSSGGGRRAAVSLWSNSLIHSCGRTLGQMDEISCTIEFGQVTYLPFRILRVLRCNI